MIGLAPLSVVALLLAPAFPPDQLPTVLTGHTTRVNAVAFSPDGTQLASAASDGTVRVWNPKTGALVKTLNGSGKAVTVAWSPDGKWLASGWTDGTLRIWKAPSLKLAHKIKAHDDWVSAMAFTSDSQLATGSYDKSVRLWNAKKGKRDKTLSVPHKVGGLVWLAESKRLASLPSAFKSRSEGASAVELIDPNGTARTGLPADAAGCMVYDATAKQLYACGRDGMIASLTVLPGGRSSGLGTSMETPVRALAIAADRTVAAGVSAGPILMFGPGMKEKKALLWHRAPITSVVFSPDGQLLAASSTDKTISLWRRQHSTLAHTRMRAFGVNAHGTLETTPIATAASTRTVAQLDSNLQFTGGAVTSDVRIFFTSGGAWVQDARRERTVWVPGWRGNEVRTGGIVSAGGVTWLIGTGLFEFRNGTSPKVSNVELPSSLAGKTILDASVVGGKIWLVTEQDILSVDPKTRQAASIVPGSLLTPFTRKGVAFTSSSLWILQGVEAGETAKVAQVDLTGKREIRFFTLPRGASEVWGAGAFAVFARKRGGSASALLLGEDNTARRLILNRAALRVQAPPKPVRNPEGYEGYEDYQAQHYMPPTPGIVATSRGKIVLESTEGLAVLDPASGVQTRLSESGSSGQLALVWSGMSYDYRVGTGVVAGFVLDPSKKPYAVSGHIYGTARMLGQDDESFWILESGQVRRYFTKKTKIQSLSSVPRRAYAHTHDMCTATLIRGDNRFRTAYPRAPWNEFAKAYAARNTAPRTPVAWASRGSEAWAASCRSGATVLHHADHQGSRPMKGVPKACARALTSPAKDTVYMGTVDALWRHDGRTWTKLNSYPTLALAHHGGRVLTLEEYSPGSLRVRGLKAAGQPEWSMDVDPIHAGPLKLLSELSLLEMVATRDLVVLSEGHVLYGKPRKWAKVPLQRWDRLCTDGNTVKSLRGCCDVGEVKMVGSKPAHSAVKSFDTKPVLQDFR